MKPLKIQDLCPQCDSMDFRFRGNFGMSIIFEQTCSSCGWENKQEDPEWKKALKKK